MLLVTRSGPRLVRTMVNTTCCPSRSVFVLADLSTIRSAIGRIFVTTTDEELLERVGSVTPSGTPTVAVLVKTPLVMACTVIWSSAIVPTPRPLLQFHQQVPG